MKLPDNALHIGFMGWYVEGQERRDLAVKNKKCAWCGESFTNNYVKYWCSQQEGNNCYTLFYNKYFIHWGKIRQQALDRDQGKCVICKKLAVEVHHIIPISLGGVIFDLDNLESLCMKHHKEKHKKNSKINYAHKLENHSLSDFIKVKN